MEVASSVHAYLQVAHSVQSENSIFFVKRVKGLAIDDLFAPKQSFRKNFSLTFFVVTTQIAKCNRLRCFDSVLKLTKIFDLSILRSNGVIWKRLY